MYHSFKLVTVTTFLLLTWNVAAASMSDEEAANQLVETLSQQCLVVIREALAFKAAHSGIKEGHADEAHKILQKERLLRYTERLASLNHQAFLVWLGVRVSASCEPNESEKFVQFLNR